MQIGIFGIVIYSLFSIIHFSHMIDSTFVTNFDILYEICVFLMAINISTVLVQVLFNYASGRAGFLRIFALLSAIVFHILFFHRFYFFFIATFSMILLSRAGQYISGKFVSRNLQNNMHQLIMNRVRFLGGLMFIIAPYIILYLLLGYKNIWLYVILNCSGYILLMLFDRLKFFTSEEQELSFGLEQGLYINCILYSLLLIFIVLLPILSTYMLPAVMLIFMFLLLAGISMWLLSMILAGLAGILVYTLFLITLLLLLPFAYMGILLIGILLSIYLIVKHISK